MTEAEYGRRMMALAKAEGHVARPPHITPELAGIARGRPENPNRARVLASIRAGNHRKADIVKATKINPNAVGDALSSLQRTGHIICEGWMWKVAG